MKLKYVLLFVNLLLGDIGSSSNYTALSYRVFGELVRKWKIAVMIYVVRTRTWENHAIS